MTWRQCLFLLLSASPLYGGAYLTDIDFGQDRTAVNHPFLYVGQGGMLSVRVCLDPNTTEVDPKEPGIERAIATWNAMTPQANNLSSDVPTGKADFESVILHELGHCALGLAHPNLGLLTNLVAGQASQADEGPDGVFDINFGPDGQPGSIDDMRGDDINRTWFYKADNYPFLFTTPVDKITYGLELGDLPPGSTFSANANRLSGTVAIPPVIGTEAAMNAYLLTGEGRSVLQHDDAATYRYAASGLDEMEGTADDYTVQFMYQGRTTSNCDVIIEDLPDPGMVAAMCIVSAVGIGGAKQHFRLAGVSQLQISSLVDWYYGPTIFSDGFEGGDLSSWSFSGQ